MEWLRISTSTELVRVATDEIVYVRADGNYSDLVLTNGKSRKMTFQLHYFDEVFQQLQNNMFARVGRSLIVKKMKLECHLATLTIGQYKVRIVAIGTDIYNLIRGDSHQFGAGRYSEPFHALTGLRQGCD